MKKTALLAALVAASAVGTSFAASTKTNGLIGDQINIAGSTAMAGVSMPAIKAYALGNGYTLTAYDALPTPSKIALFTKVVTATNGSTVTITTNAINVHFIGSEGGTVVTASKQQQPFLPLSASGVVAGDIASTGYVIPSPSCTQNASATVTFSDVNQAVGRFAAGSKTSPVKTVALTDIGALNAVNFAFVAPTNFPDANITDQVARELFTLGKIPLSHITGKAADSIHTVYLTGRDIDSGTRSLAQIETGYGIGYDVQQYVYDAPTGVIWQLPGGINRFNGIIYTAGNGGYFSGGDLCLAVGSSSTNSGTVGINGTPSFTTNAIAASTYADQTNAYKVVTATNVGALTCALPAAPSTNSTNTAWTFVSSTTNFAIIPTISFASTTNAPAGSTNYLIGYAGTADIIGKKYTKALSYNGVSPYATNSYSGFNNINNGIANGSYSLWSIEHLYVNTANAPKGTVAADITALANSVYSTILGKSTTDLGYGYTTLADLNVQRAKAEGSIIIKK